MKEGKRGRKQEPRTDSIMRVAKAARAAVEKYRPQGEALARISVEAVGRTIDSTRPEVERLARKAKPHVERTGRQAITFARNHERELTEIGGAIARAAAPRPLRFIIEVLDDARAGDSGSREEE